MISTATVIVLTNIAIFGLGYSAGSLIELIAKNKQGVKLC